MNNLTPTPIVDKNGKQTTVHKRTDKNTVANGTLSSLKPTLGSAEASKKTKAKTVTKVKASSVARFHEDSFIKTQPYEFEVEWLENGHEYYGWRKDDMEIPTSRLYDYMRRGIDLADASALEGLDLSPAFLDVNYAEHLPGRLGKVKEKNYDHRIHNQKVIDAMEEAGVPPLKAFKVLENGLQDGHMKKLSIEQLVPMFSKWRYYGVQGSLPEQNSSRLLDAVTSGDIPWALTETTTRQELSRLEGELRLTKCRVPLMELLNSDHDLFMRIAEKAVKTMPQPTLNGWDTPVTKLLKMYEDHGAEILDLRTPNLITMSKKVNGEWSPMTMENARYAEAVEKLAMDAGVEVVAVWTDVFGSMRDNSDKVKLHQIDLAALNDAGVSEDRAYEMLVLQRLSVDQALTAHADNVPSSISVGTL